jgi:hypothetical protein
MIKTVVNDDVPCGPPITQHFKINYNTVPYTDPGSGAFLTSGSGIRIRYESALK